MQSWLPAQIPDNDPEFRFSVWIAAGKEPNLAKPIQAWRERKFPVHVVSQGDKARELDASEFEHRLRWIDTLDRL